MTLALKNLVLAVALLAWGKGAVAGQCTGMKCFEPRGGNAPIEQTRPFCSGNGMLLVRENNNGVISHICYCIDGACDVFSSRCTGLGWQTYNAAGCSCNQVKECN